MKRPPALTLGEIRRELATPRGTDRKWIILRFPDGFIQVNRKQVVAALDAIAAKVPTVTAGLDTFNAAEAFALQVLTACADCSN